MATTQTTEKSINWGGVAKGAIVLGAVVAAVVVGYALFGAAAEPISQFVGNSPFLQNLGANLMNGWDFLTEMASKLWTEFGKVASELGNMITKAIAPAAGTSNFTNAITPESTKKGLQAIGALTFGAAAVPAAASALHHTSFVTEHAAHHAAEHGEKSWVGRQASRRREAGDSFASRAPQPAASNSSFTDNVTKRGASHVDAETLRAATANLNKEIG